MLRALANRAADGKSTTIAHDWGFGGGTLIDEAGAHTHFGGDWYESEGEALNAFVSGLHSCLSDGPGLSWVAAKASDA